MCKSLAFNQNTDIPFDLKKKHAQLTCSQPLTEGEVM